MLINYYIFPYKSCLGLLLFIAGSPPVKFGTFKDGFCLVEPIDLNLAATSVCASVGSLVDDCFDIRLDLLQIILRSSAESRNGVSAH